MSFSKENILSTAALDGIAAKLDEELSKLYESENLTWNPTYIQNFPKKFIRHGDMLVFPLSAFHQNCWKDIDEKKLFRCVAKVFRVNRIATQGKILQDGIRSPTVRMLLGEDTIVTHIDNKIRYSFDMSKCMFSAGNITEKLRMSKLDCQGEIIVDMFAGIGYFTLPLLVHAKAKLVHACEWNCVAVEALRRNLKDNNVEQRCVIHAGDNREVAPVGVADRVVLGLIPTAEGSYAAACLCLNRGTGGIMHIHGNVSSSPDAEGDDLLSEYANFEVSCNRKTKSAWKAWAVRTSAKIQSLLNETSDGSEIMEVSSMKWQTTILHIERVKSYAPHIDHLVLDLQCLPRNVG